MLRFPVGTTLCLLVALVTSAIPVGAAHQQSSTQEISQKFETAITDSLNSSKIREAIIATSQYDQALHALYPVPTYVKGLLQSEADHMSFLCPFDGWTRVDTTGAKFPDWLPSIGVDVTLLLENRPNHDKLAVFSADFSLLTRMSGDPNLTESEKYLSIFAKMMGQSFGVQKYSSFANIGEHKVLSIELAGMTGNSVDMRLFSHNDKVYAFIVSYSPSEKAVIKTKLLSMMKTVAFHDKPDQSTRIAAIRAKVSDRLDVKQQLQCIRELALGGEYSAACADLDKLRLTIAERIPKPVQVGDEMRNDAYGIVVSNPDPMSWKSEVQTSGGMSVMMLQDKSSVDMNGIIVGVLDPLITYGSHADQLLGIGKGEEAQKSFLSNGGRGGLLNLGGSIEKERFRTFKGMLAYEGTATTNIPNVKAKIILVLHSNYVLFLLMFVNPSNVDRQTTAYEEILTKSLTLK